METAIHDEQGERPVAGARPNARPMATSARHAMSIDVEEFFQVWALRNHYARSQWDDIPSRVVDSTGLLLDLMEATGTRATFFTLGWVAERHPALIRRIVAEGHELASHGYDHQLVREMTEQAFREDLARSKALLEEAGGVEVTGYRAPNFSIDASTPWAYEALLDAGYRYSSSSHPVANDHYGDVRGERRPHRRDGIVELPVTVLPLAGRNLPCAGGGYFRILPLAWTRFALDRVAREPGARTMFYLHPWEVDPAQPRPGRLGLSTRFRHYTRLSKCASMLKDLMQRFAWDRIDRVYADELNP
ncbi:MAG: DUF3473 domain-containing protein [Geminicoccaceae bacterium]